MGKRKPSENELILEGKTFAILSYLSICCIIPLVFKKDNEFVLRHSKQGLVLFVAEVAIFVLHILLGVWIWKWGMFILGSLSFIGIIFVLRGQYVNLPIISDIAEKLTI